MRHRPRGSSSLQAVMLSASETTGRGFAGTFLLVADEDLQSYARKFRALALTCAQDDNMREKSPFGGG